MIVGFCWAALSNPLITFFFRRMSLIEQDVYRSLNDLVFVAVISVVLYLKIKKQHNKLVKSEEEYRQLFEANPNPLLIYNESNLHIVKVNKAAIEKYAYSRRKFLKMTMADIQCGEQEKIPSDFNEEHQYGLGLATTCRHKKASGEAFDVSVISYPVLFNKEKCNLLMASDITDLLEKERKLKEADQKVHLVNKALVEVAWSNSHELRRPLCSILSLVSLLKDTTDKQEFDQFLELLEVSSVELDGVLRQNNKKMTEIELKQAI